VPPAGPQASIVECSARTVGTSPRRHEFGDLSAGSRHQRFRNSGRGSDRGGRASL